MKKLLSVVLTVILCASLIFSGCSSQIKTENDKELNKSIVLTVGDIKYTQADYNFVYKLLYDNMAQYSQFYGDDWLSFEIEDGKTIGDFIKENTMLQLKQLAAANILAEENGVKADSDVKKTVKTNKEEIIKNNYGGEEEYIKFLEETRTTDKAIDTYLQMYEVYNRYYEKITAEGGAAYIEDKDAEKDFLEAYKDKLCVKHVLISTMEQTDEEGNPAPARSDEEAQALVKEVIAKLDAGEDFDKLIDEYDEDPGMESGGFYVFGDGEMVAEFEEASKELEIGEYTKEGIKSDFGYHIIKRYELNTELNEFAQFKEVKMQEKTTELIEKKLEGLTVKAEDKIIDKYVADWQKAIKEAEEQAAADNAEGSSEFMEETPAE